MNRHAQEIVRYAINGIVATLVHYVVLTVNITVFALESAGFANLIAAIFGITTSFLGSRYFVFQNTSESIVTQVITFSSLYGAIAVLHGVVLFIWADWFGLDYRAGFLIATAMQVSLSYFGNKFLVFKT